LGAIEIDDVVAAPGDHEYVGEPALVTTDNIVEDPLHMVTLLTDAVGKFLMVAVTGTLADKQPLTSVRETA
jgi:hypothetical protein